MRPSPSVLHRLPNVGGNDHTYAYHMASLSSRQDLDFASVVVFAKDTVNYFHQNPKYYRRHPTSIMDANTKAAGPSGFGCFIEAYGALSAFADSVGTANYSGKHLARAPLYAVPKFMSRYRNLEHWLKEVTGVDLPTPAVPTCYGGDFVANMKT